MTNVTLLEKEKLKERVKRCLKLAGEGRNNSPEEAATALAFANKIMREYNISLSEVQIDDIKKQEVVQGGGVLKKKFKGWEFSLSSVVASLCSCGVFRRTFYLEDSKLIFYGIKEDVDLAEQIYSILRKEILRMATSQGFKGAEQRSYCLGVVITLMDRIREEKKEEEALEEGNKCRAVMVIKNQLVKAYTAKLKLRTARGARVGSYSAYDRGRQDGHSVNMRPDRNQLE